jgi:transcriptional regulator with XRE-family HTH domain
VRIVSEVEPQEIFGRNVSRERLRRDWTQEQLADNAALHFTEISKLELGRRSPTLKTMLKLARALEVELAVLVRDIH